MQVRQRQAHADNGQTCSLTVRSPTCCCLPCSPIVRLTMRSGSGWLQQTSPRQPPPPAWHSRNAGWWARCTALWPTSRQRTSGEGGAASAGALSHAAARCCRAAVDLPTAVSSCRRFLPSCPVCSHLPALPLTCSSVGLTLARPADCCTTLCGATLQTGEREA